MPVLEELARERDDLRVAIVNIDETPEFGELRDLAVPSLVLFKDGQDVHHIVGARAKSELIQAIDSALAPKET